ncbi:MAG: FkbM family methyltransferase [Planctomycetaceae bacterium]|nr:FkbM family methyltransferase [Planctomycetaceae bacterium]MCA9083674.1 FkbM family methyltransferase [Planctomycetaceae bacterium]
MISAIRQRLRKYLANRLRVPSIESSLERLARFGYEPAGVYDVGAYKGEFTETVLSIWPTTRVTCFEPQITRIRDLERLVNSNPGIVTFESCLLGAEVRDAVPFHLHETASSVLAYSAGVQYDTTELAMTTIDEYRSRKGSLPCSLLKLDVQGYELDVLKGAEHTICNETELILAEVNFLDLYADVPLLDKTLSWLAERDFLAYDISSLIRRPLDDALWQADFIFTRAESIFRRNKQTGYPE